MKVALLDFGVGNMHSLAKALEAGGATVRISRPDELPDVDAFVLPGVGAFGAAAQALAPDADELRRRLHDGIPCLGICLGMQLLFETSDESPGEGIGLLPGRVRRLAAARTPQMGWNRVETAPDDPLFEGLEAPIVYYANRYVVPDPLPANAYDVIGTTEYEGDRFPAALRHGRIRATQFHPEKSGAHGLRIIANFLRFAEGA